MNSTKLKTAGASLGTWLLRLAPFWVPVALAILMLQVGAPLLFWFFFMCVLAFSCLLNLDKLVSLENKNKTLPLKFLGALVVGCALLFSGVTVSTSDAIIHNGVVTKNKTEYDLHHGFWYKSTHTVVQNTHQDVSYETAYLNEDDAKHTLRVSLGYDVPAEILLKHQANGSTPDYRQVFSNALEKSVMRTIQTTASKATPKNVPNPPQDAAQVILSHLEPQLDALGSSVVSISVEIELDNTTMTYTSSNSQGMLSAEGVDEN